MRSRKQARGFRTWRNRNIVEHLEAFGPPVLLQNGSRLRAFAENWYGATQDVDDFLYFHLDHGIGGAIVLSGNLVEGPSHGAGEFGHMPLLHKELSARGIRR